MFDLVFVWLKLLLCSFPHVKNVSNYNSINNFDSIDMGLCATT